MKDEAYKSYLIRSNPMNGLIWVEKDKVNIATVKSIEEGKNIINLLKGEITMPESEGSPTIAKLVARIKELESEVTKSSSERGALEAELKKMKDELEEANSWLP